MRSDASSALVDKSIAAGCSWLLPFGQAKAAPCLTDHSRKPFNLCGQYRVAHLSQSIFPAGRGIGITGGSLFDEPRVEKLLYVVVERSWSNFVLASGLARHLQHAPI